MDDKINTQVYAVMKSFIAFSFQLTLSIF